MSAFRLSARHIAAMVDGLLNSGRAGETRFPMLNPHTDERFVLTPDSRREICEMLDQTNIDSLYARYPRLGEELHGEYPEVSPLALRKLGGAVGLLKAIDCYEYQSCEHAGWLTSNARVFCANMRARLGRDLPGYDDAPTWGIADE